MSLPNYIGSLYPQNKGDALGDSYNPFGKVYATKLMLSSGLPGVNTISATTGSSNMDILEIKPISSISYFNGDNLYLSAGNPYSGNSVNGAYSGGHLYLRTGQNSYQYNNGSYSNIGTNLSIKLQVSKLGTDRESPTTNGVYLYDYKTIATIDSEGIIPGSSATYDLGSSSYKWRNLLLSGNASIDGTTTLGSTLSVTGAASFNNNVTLGDANTDTITATGRFTSDLTPSTNNTRKLGESSLRWNEGYVNSLNANSIAVNTTLNAKGNVTLGDASSDTVSVNGVVDTNVIPSANKTKNLGSDAARWNDVYGTLAGDEDGFDVNYTDTGTVPTDIDFAGNYARLDEVRGKTVAIDGVLHSARNVKVKSKKANGESHGIVAIPSDWYTKAETLGYDIGMEGCTIDFNAKTVTWTKAISDGEVVDVTSVTKTFEYLGFAPINNFIPIEAGGTISVLSDGAQAEVKIHYYSQVEAINNAPEALAFAHKAITPHETLTSNNTVYVPEGKIYANGKSVEYMTRPSDGLIRPWMVGKGGYQVTNLLSTNKSFSSVSGVTIVTNKDGSYTLNGTASADITLTLGTVTTTSGHNYVLTGCPYGGSSTSYRLTSSNPSLTNIGSGAYGSASSTSSTINIVITSGTVLSEITFKPIMIDSTESLGYTTLTDYMTSIGMTTDALKATWSATYLNFFTGTTTLERALNITNLSVEATSGYLNNKIIDVEAPNLPTINDFITEYDLTVSVSTVVTRTLTIPGVTTTSNQFWMIPNNATSVQVEATVNAGIQVTAQSTNSMTIKFNGVVPTIAIPIHFIIIRT